MAPPPPPRGRSVLIVAAVALAASFAPARALVILRQLGPCSVETDRGTVDLSALSRGSPPRFANTTSNAYPGVVYYDWNPCKDFSEPEVGSVKSCQSIALCAFLPQASGQSATYLPYGNQASANFKLVSGQLAVIYSSPIASTVATVVLQCNPAAPNSLSCTFDEDYQNIVFRYSGSSACYVESSTTGLKISIGTILCLALAAGLVIYLLVGLVVMKFVKKSEKPFPVPNVVFWTELPGYTKDGLTFAVSCLKMKRQGFQQF